MILIGLVRADGSKLDFDGEVVGVHLHGKLGNGLTAFVDNRDAGWYAQVRMDGKVRHLGSFTTIEEAESAVVEAHRQIYGGSL